MLIGLNLVSPGDVQECIKGGGTAIAASGDGCSEFCRLEYCGDSIVQVLGADGILGTLDDEQCDPSLGPTTGLIPGTIIRGCDVQTCKFVRCGNGIRQGLEQCDDGNTDIYDDCTPSCRFPVCGNRVVEGKEECDDGNNLDGDGCFDNCALMIPPERLL